MSQFETMFAAVGASQLAERFGRPVVRKPFGGADVQVSDAIISDEEPAEMDEPDGKVIVHRKMVKASSSYFAVAAGGAVQPGERWTIDGLDWDFDTQTPTSDHAGMVTLGVIRFAPVDKTHQNRETRSV